MLVHYVYDIHAFIICYMDVFVVYNNNSSLDHIEGYLIVCSIYFFVLFLY
jgi:hypothetical protein